MHKINKFILRHKALLLLIALALLLRFPWLYTTMERDEGTFGYTAWRILSGDSLYLDWKDNKPPFLYVLYALPISIFGNDIIPARIFNNLLFLASVVFFFLLIKKKYGKKIGIPSTVFYVLLMNIPSAEGPLAVSESFMTSFFIISVYFFDSFLKKQNYYFLAISITLMCIAILTRHNALGGLLLIYFLLYKERKLGLKELFFMIIPPALFLFLAGYFFYTGSLPNILKIVLAISTQIPFSYSLLVISESAFILLFTFIGFVTIFKRKEIKKYLLIVLWFLFLTPFLFFPRSFHHLLTLAPPTAVFASIGFNTFIRKGLKKEKIFITILILLLTLSSFLIIKQYPNYHFRLNNIKIIYSGLENYQQQALLSERIKSLTSPGDKILLWGWEPGIYWLSERKSVLQTMDIRCDRFYDNPKNITLEQFEKKVYHDDVKAIIFLPGYPRKCAGSMEEVFSDPSPAYNKIKIDGIEGYIQRYWAEM